MNRKNDILSNTFRNRLKDYLYPADENLWHEIEKDLAERSARRKARFRFISAAAGIALILGLSVLLMKKEPANPDTAETKTEYNDPVANPSNNKPAPIDDDKNVLLSAETPVNRSKSEKKSALNNQKTTDTSTVAEGVDENKKPEDDGENQANPDEKPRINSDVPELMAGNEKPVKKIAEQEYRLPAGPTKRKQNLSIALAYGNSGAFSSMNSTSTQYRYSQKFAESGTDYSSAPLYLGSANEKNLNKNEKEINCKYPLSFGVSVRKHFSDRFALESGLTYTYLSSTETQRITGLGILKRDIELNYIGIPVKGVYSFYRTKNTTLYLSGGGMAEKCVYGKETLNDEKTRTLNVSNLQWSIFGNAGINYNLTRHFGIFLEPGAGYYFDDDTEIQTIRKKSPINFNVQAGIRWVY